MAPSVCLPAFVTGLLKGEHGNYGVQLHGLPSRPAAVVPSVRLPALATGLLEGFQHVGSLSLTVLPEVLLLFPSLAA